jgi:hypothetical protein
MAPGGMIQTPMANLVFFIYPPYNFIHIGVVTMLDWFERVCAMMETKEMKDIYPRLYDMDIYINRGAKNPYIEFSGKRHSQDRLGTIYFDPFNQEFYCIPERDVKYILRDVDSILWEAETFYIQKYGREWPDVALKVLK